MLKFLRVPFGQSGDRTAVPDAVAPGGDVSYTEGYGVDYSRPKTDPLSKNIEREKMNQIFFDTTTAIGELQAQGVPDFITTVLNGGSPFAYAQNAIVRFAGSLYISLVAANTATPADATKWAVLNLGKTRVVVGTGVAATDVANIQAAVNAAGNFGIVELQGNFATNAAIMLKPMLTVRGNNASITHSNAATNLFEYKPGTPTGFPGFIEISDLQVTGPGTSGNSFFLFIDANSPYTRVKRIYGGQFFGGIYLRDSYLSTVEQCGLYNFQHGIQLLRESHAFALLNTQIDGCSIAALSINYGGGAGTGPCHNVNVIGGSLQNSAVGLWAENCLELHTVGVYHEGNTVSDYRIGVADGGAYARAAYNTIIDGFSSASPCGGGINVRIEHAVGVSVRSAAWNSGTSTTASLLDYDGFSDRVAVDMLRFSTVAPTATAPLNFSVDTTRGVATYAGKLIAGAGQSDAISVGTLASKLAQWGYQQFGGRDSAIMKSSLDVVLQVGAGGVIKVKDSAGADQFVVTIPFSNSLPGVGSKQIWYDPADGNRVKFQP